MDISRLGFQYSPEGATPAQPTVPVSKGLPFAETEAEPELNLFDFQPDSSSELRLNHDRLELFNHHYSDSRALLALKIEPPDYSLGGHPQHEIGGLRSPFLQKQAQNFGKAMIQTPLKEAWKSREWDSTSVRAVGLGVGALAAALYSPTEIKSRLTLHQTELGDYKLKSGLGLVSGQGDLNFAGAKVSVSPSHNGPKHWNLDLEYKPQDDRVGLSYQRSVSRVHVGPSDGVSFLRAGLSNDRQQGTIGQLSYHLNY